MSKNVQQIRCCVHLGNIIQRRLKLPRNNGGIIFNFSKFDGFRRRFLNCEKHKEKILHIVGGEKMCLCQCEVNNCVSNKKF